jgi:hypothetical protein
VKLPQDVALGQPPWLIRLLSLGRILPQVAVAAFIVVITLGSSDADTPIPIHTDLFSHWIELQPFVLGRVRI